MRQERGKQRPLGKRGRLRGDYGEGQGRFCGPGVVFLVEGDISGQEMEREVCSHDGNV